MERQRGKGERDIGTHIETEGGVERDIGTDRESGERNRHRDT